MGPLNHFWLLLCLQVESLLHIVAGCKTYLDQGRFIWRHNSALRFLAQTFQSVNSSKKVRYLSPCIITGDSLRPDMLLSTALIINISISLFPSYLLLLFARLFIYFACGTNHGAIQSLSVTKHASWYYYCFSTELHLVCIFLLL